MRRGISRDLTDADAIAESTFTARPTSARLLSTLLFSGPLSGRAVASMGLGPLWFSVILAIVFICFDVLNSQRAFTLAASTSGWSTTKKLALRNNVRELFYHGYNNYLDHAFPFDELAPLSCAGRGPDWYSPSNIAVNDVNGNFSLTLVDTLDTLVVLGDTAAFSDGVRSVIDHVSFDVNTKPQIFEANIRVLGGLLSAHIFANQTGQPFFLPWYRGELLELAHDLGERFLPAFNTPTGLPYARINLRHGLVKGESIESCTAGAGSLMLEFATLSRLTGDMRFEKAARKAFFAVWNARSEIGLVGNQINIMNGQWHHPQMSSIGAGIDSFFEYALKWYILSGDPEFLDVWNESYASVMQYSRSGDGFWFRRVDLSNGNLLYYTYDSLSAFWPGLQVIAGDIDNAIKSHMFFWNLWQKYSGLPEVYDMNYKTATSLAFPLRPEFVESTWYLYRATRDPFYLDVGMRILGDITARSKVACGLTGIADLRTNQRDDRMESFVLSETLKYLYLLFDEENPLHTDDSNWVFTTEGHILTLDHSLLKAPSRYIREFRRGERLECPAYFPPEFSGYGDKAGSGLTVGIRTRTDFDYPTHLLGMDPINEVGWHPQAECVMPKVDVYLFEFIMSADSAEEAVEDKTPSTKKIALIPGGFMVQDIKGLRTRVTTRIDGRGYDITKLGPYTVRTGQTVYLNDSRLAGMLGTRQPVENRPPDVRARFYVDGLAVDPILFSLDEYMRDVTNLQTLFSAETETESPYVDVVAQTALFGGDPTRLHSASQLQASIPSGVVVIREQGNDLGCIPFAGAYTDVGAVLVLRRGQCTFLEKLRHAKEAGAAGIVVLSDEEGKIQPSIDPSEHTLAGALNDVVALVLRASEGARITAMLDAVEQSGGRIVMVLDPDGEEDESGGVEIMIEDDGIPAHRVLHINGHPLLNTQLLV
ncbi:glycoside hydrolase family 47 protein [Peniophora sp. CONT]|nr:glycoside hydrolase family 47 protein [Peniophora sp. CONT]